jgi:hypothetical protein
MRWAGHVACVGERRGAYRVLLEKPLRKRPLGRPRHGWEDDIKIVLKDIVWEGVDWIGPTRNRDG